MNKAIQGCSLRLSWYSPGFVDLDELADRIALGRSTKSSGRRDQSGLAVAEIQEVMN